MPLEPVVKAAIIKVAGNLIIELDQSSDKKLDLDEMIKLFGKAYAGLTTILGIPAQEIYG